MDIYFYDKTELAGTVLHILNKHKINDMNCEMVDGRLVLSDNDGNQWINSEIFEFIRDDVWGGDDPELKKVLSEEDLSLFEGAENCADLMDSFIPPEKISDLYFVIANNKGSATGTIKNAGELREMVETVSDGAFRLEDITNKSWAVHYINSNKCTNFKQAASVEEVMKFIAGEYRDGSWTFSARLSSLGLFSDLPPKTRKKESVLGALNAKKEEVSAPKRPDPAQNRSKEESL